MFRKIAPIKNTGRFVKCSPNGDVELRRYNLVFGENGRGKTTLCAILRSLQTGDPAYVVGRKTLGGTDSPEIAILMNTGGHAFFTKGTWNRTVPEIAIFDATFVSENVHSGDVVDIEHRRSLYSVIVGEQGVKLAKQIDDIDEKVRAKNTELREKAAALQILAPGITPDNFVALETDPAIDQKIEAKEKELAAARQAAQLKGRAGLNPVVLPTVPLANLDTLLAKTIAGIATDAQQRVSVHIKKHGMKQMGQAWISEGLGYVSNNSCPFCDQNLDSANSILRAFRDFFSKAYDELRKSISEMRRQIDLDALNSSRTMGSLRHRDDNSRTKVQNVRRDSSEISQCAGNVREQGTKPPETSSLEPSDLQLARQSGSNALNASPADHSSLCITNSMANRTTVLVLDW